MCCLNYLIRIITNFFHFTLQYVLIFHNITYILVFYVTWFLIKYPIINVQFITGDNYKHVRVGQLCTPVGTIHLSVSYRTKMTISPTHKGRDSIMLKSDHFHSDLSPRHTRYQQKSVHVEYLEVIKKKKIYIYIYIYI